MDDPTDSLKLNFYLNGPTCQSFLLQPYPSPHRTPLLLSPALHRGVAAAERPDSAPSRIEPASMLDEHGEHGVHPASRRCPSCASSGHSRATSKPRRAGCALSQPHAPLSSRALAQRPGRALLCRRASSQAQLCAPPSPPRLFIGLVALSSGATALARRADNRRIHRRVLPGWPRRCSSTAAPARVGTTAWGRSGGVVRGEAARRSGILRARGLAKAREPTGGDAVGESNFLFYRCCWIVTFAFLFIFYR
jgi:hypothetical protein